MNPQLEMQVQVHDDDQSKWVRDSSVDHKGSIPLRSSTGVWKASLFILAIEFVERMTYFGIATNLITYLTGVMHQELDTAAKNVNYWAGVTTVIPLCGAFLADAYFGRFPMILGSSLLYFLGLGLLTMTQYVPSLKPCSTKEACLHARITHEVTFFIAAYMISIGTGGFKPCLESFGADQFDENHSEERRQKASYFNWWNVALGIALILGVTIIVYIEDNIGWGIAFLICTVTMALTIVVFYLGKRVYRYQAAANRSPFTPMLQVLVASFTKRHLPYPSDATLLYEVIDAHGSQRRRLCHTNKLRFLDKASILAEETSHDRQQKQSNAWKLATVTQVEEFKLILSIIPIWITSTIVGVNIAQCVTFFVKQASVMNRRISSKFEIPPASTHAISGLGMILSVSVYDRILLPFLRRATGTEQGITILKRIGIGMMVSTVAMVVATLVEQKRQRSNVTLSVAWVVPQFFIIGVGEGFVLVGLQEYYYKEVPDAMRSLGMALYLSAIGIGSFLSSFLIAIVNDVTAKYGSSGWIGKDVKHSRLDLYYCVLVALNGVNLVVFVILARNYTYKTVEKSADVVESHSCV